jgi:hypothetical protein
MGDRSIPAGDEVSDIKDTERNEAMWITSYLDEEIRVGLGAKGNLFVFRQV